MENSCPAHSKNTLKTGCQLVAAPLGQLVLNQVVIGPVRIRGGEGNPWLEAEILGSVTVSHQYKNCYRKTAIGMQHEGTFLNWAQQPLFYRHWPPQAEETKAVVVLIHGLGGHSGLFQPVAEVLAPLGYDLWALDLRGNGRSPGQRGHVNRWAEYREDVAAFVDFIAPQVPDVPWFLLGHSVGGAIALDCVLRSPERWQGVIVSAPTLGKVGVSPLRFAIARLLSQLWPTFSLSTGVKVEAAARDPAVLARQQQDTLRHGLGSARLATEYLAAVDWLQAHAHTLSVPLLMLQGGQDCVAPIDTSRHFFDRLPPHLTTWRDYPESYHEIYEDLDAPLVLADLADWLNSHLLRSTPT